MSCVEKGGAPSASSQEQDWCHWAQRLILFEIDGSNDDHDTMGLVYYIIDVKAGGVLLLARFPSDGSDDSSGSTDETIKLKQRRQDGRLERFHDLGTAGRSLTTFAGRMQRKVLGLLT